ncbi:ABC transporter ATP-binding protein [Pseudothermotoga thermarum]|uniref:ABC transporter related protein n=1 Tax=Pseudothermotoga thermarum DSM 5069 TaxID=688269 RepID=F7YVX6_9THEM|nr:ABC transporter ATP-binding protein [Pseudothermotoga thermarum]AEH51801.1 ABC transporter related protein [Pseudothermotoga thermarum DSM 5069]
MVIEVKGLTKYYGKTKAIENVSFSVKEGEIVGFVGPNGAGKTTTIRIILGLLKPTSGKVYVFGKDVQKDYANINSQVGYIPGEVNYYPGVKVKEFLKYALRFHKDVDRDYFDFLCDMLKIEMDKKVEDLSLGNKKKLAIVQAFVHRPKLYIFDEPTNGLDPLQKQLYDLIRKERAERGATFFFSSHNLSEVQKLCDRVIFIRKGQLIKEPSEYFNMKKVRMLSNSNCSDLKNLANVFNFKEQSGMKEFYYNGKINNLLEKLKEYDIEDLIIEDVSLEEIFEELYKN